MKRYSWLLLVALLLGSMTGDVVWGQIVSNGGGGSFSLTPGGTVGNGNSINFGTGGSSITGDGSGNLTITGGSGGVATLEAASGGALHIGNAGATITTLGPIDLQYGLLIDNSGYGTPTPAAGCGTGATLATGSTNSGGRITTNASSFTTCSLAFQVSFPNDAFCMLNDHSRAAFISTVSKSGFTMSNVVGGDVVEWTCFGR